MSKGSFVLATVSRKKRTYLKIDYDGWSQKWAQIVIKWWWFQFTSTRADEWHQLLHLQMTTNLRYIIHNLPRNYPPKIVLAAFCPFATSSNSRKMQQKAITMEPRTNNVPPTTNHDENPIASANDKISFPEFRAQFETGKSVNRTDLESCSEPRAVNATPTAGDLTSSTEAHQSRISGQRPLSDNRLDRGSVHIDSHHKHSNTSSKHKHHQSTTSIHRDHRTQSVHHSDSPGPSINEIDSESPPYRLYLSSLSISRHNSSVFLFLNALMMCFRAFVEIFFVSMPWIVLILSISPCFLIVCWRLNDSIVRALCECVGVVLFHVRCAHWEHVGDRDGLRLLSVYTFLWTETASTSLSECTFDCMSSQWTIKQNTREIGDNLNDRGNASKNISSSLWLNSLCTTFWIKANAQKQQFYPFFFLFIESVGD